MAPYDDFKLLLRQRRFKEAAALAEGHALGNDGEPTFWLNQQAIALLRWGRFSEAVAIADGALLRNPAGFYSLLIRSEALFKQGDVAGALAGFQEAKRFPKAQARALRGILECLIALRRI